MDPDAFRAAWTRSGSRALAQQLLRARGARREKPAANRRGRRGPGPPGRPPLDTCRPVQVCGVGQRPETLRRAEKLENLGIILRNADGAAGFDTAEHSRNAGRTFESDLFEYAMKTF